MSVVIIPAYKPDERLVGIVDQLWTYGFRIVVVDDGSGKIIWIFLTESTMSAFFSAMRKTEEKVLPLRLRLIM